MTPPKVLLTGQELRCDMWARGRAFGTAANPFGSAVTDPDTDLRLVSLAPPYTFPTAFAGGPNLFGQGAELRVERFEIHSAAAG